MEVCDLLLRKPSARGSFGKLKVSVMPTIPTQSASTDSAVPDRLRRCASWSTNLAN